MEQGEELKEARGYTCLILIRQEGTEGESPESSGNRRVEPPSNLIEHRAVTHEVQGGVRKVLRYESCGTRSILGLPFI